MTLKGRVITFRIGLIKKLIKPSIIPAKISICQFPFSIKSTPGIYIIASHIPAMPAIICRNSLHTLLNPINFSEGSQSFDKLRIDAEFNRMYQSFDKLRIDAEFNRMYQSFGKLRIDAEFNRMYQSFGKLRIDAEFNRMYQSFDKLRIDAEFNRMYQHLLI